MMQLEDGCAAAALGRWVASSCFISCHCYFVSGGELARIGFELGNKRLLATLKVRRNWYSNDPPSYYQLGTVLAVLLWHAMTGPTYLATRIVLRR